MNKTWSVNSREPRIHVRFTVAYPTTWGQRLVLIGSSALLGSWKVENGVSMECFTEGSQILWKVEAILPPHKEYEYTYRLLDSQDRVVNSELYTHLLTIGDFCLEHDPVVDVVDTWQDRSYEGSIFGTSAFVKVINAENSIVRNGVVPREEAADSEVVVRFNARDWGLKKGEVLCVSGAIPQLGSWAAERAFQLAEFGAPAWEGEIRVPVTLFPFTYKYMTCSRDCSCESSEGLEAGEHRVAALPPADGTRVPSLLVFNDGHFRRRLQWRGAGIAVPVFSLRTEDSVGCGDFMDVKKLVDLAELTGARLVQLLPVNDTQVYNNWWDSYPYSSISVHALHPLYLRLQRLSDNLPPSILAQIEEQRAELQQLPDMNYERTIQAKTTIARQVFDSGCGAADLESADCQAWMEENSSWLRPYAAFCFLRDLYCHSEHWRWGDLSHPTAEALDRILSPSQEWHATVRFRYWLQWHLHRQLLEVSQYATGKRVALKGDLPIGVDKRSIDTWVNPQLFRMNRSTGAPPDYFDPNGQNWGFPTYNWQAMKQDNYAWWRSRLTHMAQYFHAYRIDHILGFFRIWEIPDDAVSGVLGYFRPSHPIQREELEAKGLWDVQRLVCPHIRWHLLQELFGELAEEVAGKYLKETAPGQWQLKPRYNTERAIVQQVQSRKDSPAWLEAEVSQIREGLLHLRRNIILLQSADDPDHFFPRFAFTSTSSFKELPNEEWKRHLAWLHDDYFHRRQEALWTENALATLPVLLNATDMLVCGEDLGFIPACVHPVMSRLGLLSLRIQRMSSEPGREFGDTESYPYLSVASPSCHDTIVTRAWWEQDVDRRERFFYRVLGGGGYPPSKCTPDITAEIVARHLNSPSVLAIFPIQDLMALSENYLARPALEETINDPTNPKHYWRFRIAPTLEQLIADKELIGAIQTLMLASGRCTRQELPSS